MKWGKADIFKILHGEVAGEKPYPNSSTVSHKPGTWNKISWQPL